MKNESIATSYCINIPEDATNGDVIKAMFPNREVHDGYTVVYYGVEIRVDRDFWEAPYKAKSEAE